MLSRCKLMSPVWIIFQFLFDHTPGWFSIVPDLTFRFYHGNNKTPRKERANVYCFQKNICSRCQKKFVLQLIHIILSACPVCTSSLLHSLLLQAHSAVFVFASAA